MKSAGTILLKCSGQQPVRFCYGPETGENECFIIMNSAMVNWATSINHGAKIWHNIAMASGV